MVITYYGLEFFKVQTGDTVLAFNPIGKGSSLKAARFGADVVFVTTEHDDFNGSENMSYGEKKPLVISGPGEYETRGIFVKGFQTKTTYGGSELISTVYSVQFDAINICFLGTLTSKESITNEIKEDLGDIDILFTPIGGGDVLESSEAYKLAVSLAPKLIIPMHFSGKDILQAFLKDVGNSIKPIDKLTIKKRELDAHEGDIVVLDPIK